ncbi:MAG: EF-hand domain-containing protein [Mariprofundaceae bacterium]
MINNNTLNISHRPTPPSAEKLADHFFAKVDPTNSGSFNKNALNKLVDKVSISTASVDAMFTKMDQNGDGSVSKQEFTDTLKSLSPDMRNSPPAQGGSHAGPPPRGGHGGPPPTQGQASTVVYEDPADTDGDGVVSTIEALAYSQANPADNEVNLTTADENPNRVSSEFKTVIDSYTSLSTTEGKKDNNISSFG